MVDGGFRQQTTDNEQPTTKKQKTKKMEYTNLDIWVEARKLTNLVYEKTKQFPKEELYSLVNQIRRCAVSVPSNIAEGCGRRTSNETNHFLHITRGSLYELETQMYSSLDQKYISENEFEEILNQILICKKLINGFINYYKKLG
jgi:four helix bundle protein